MPTKITMPQLSDTMTEGTVVKWHKKEGDKVKEGEKVADVETDKAVMEMESSEAGTLAAILVKEGEKVAVGAALAVVAKSNENAADVKKSAGGSSKAVKSEGATASTSQGNVATLEAASMGEIHEPDKAGHGATRSAPEAVPPVPVHQNGDRIKVSPLAKKIAADKGINLSQIKGSGPGGRIVQRDLLDAPAQGATSALPQAAKPQAVKSPPGAKEVIPLTKIRTVIANRLQQSKQTIPHFYETIDIDMEAASALREKLNKQLEKEKVRLSVGDLIAKAVAKALQLNPALNATFNGTEITRYADVNLGMAVALPEGLIVPVLRGIGNLGLKDIRTKSADLIDRARAQKLKQDEMTGATFTVSNLGTFGIREFSAIVNPPEVGILAIGSAEQRAVVRDGQIVARTMMTVTLSADHRVVDGATAAEFMRTLKNLLEEPGMMLV
jgi:pyruvate dehydrogenase E2 component (dihydrolipoamide acetyltransferase)